MPKAKGCLPLGEAAVDQAQQGYDQGGLIVPIGISAAILKLLCIGKCSCDVGMRARLPRERPACVIEFELVLSEPSPRGVRGGRRAAGEASELCIEGRTG